MGWVVLAVVTLIAAWLWTKHLAEEAREIEEARRLAAWNDYLSQQHEYVSRLIKLGELPPYSVGPFYEHNAMTQVLALAEDLMAVRQVKTKKARENRTNRIARGFDSVTKESLGEITPATVDVLRQAMISCNSYHLRLTAEEEADKYLRAARRAKYKKTIIKNLAQAMVVINHALLGKLEEVDKEALLSYKKMLSEIAATTAHLVH